MESDRVLTNFVKGLRDVFSEKRAAVGHLKCALTCAGKSMWINLTGLGAEPALSDHRIPPFTSGTLLVNARVKMEPGELEAIVRDALIRLGKDLGIDVDIIDLQCFSPAYPTPPYLIRNPATV
jgi:hypothetical protein